MVRISVHDPFPGKFETSGAGHWGHRPSTDHWAASIPYYAYNYGPPGLLDPGNVPEYRAWSRSLGPGRALAVTIGRASGLPFIYGVLSDPHHVRRGGWDDSHFAIADDRRRHPGEPFSYGAAFGSAQAWSWSNRSV